MSLYDFPSKRIALRRASPCGTVGRLSRGFAQPNLQRAGDTSDPGAGRASLRRAGINRVGEVPSCGSTVFFSNSTVFSYGVGGPADGREIIIRSLIVPFGTIPDVPLGLIISTSLDEMWLSISGGLGAGFGGGYISIALSSSNVFTTGPYLWRLEAGGTDLQEGVITRSFPCQNGDPPFTTSGGNCDPFSSFGLTPPILPVAGPLDPLGTRTVPFANPNPAGNYRLNFVASAPPNTALAPLHTGMYRPNIQIVSV